MAGSEEALHNEEEGKADTLLEYAGIEKPETVGEVLDLDDDSVLQSFDFWQRVLKEEPISTELRALNNIFDYNDYIGTMCLNAYQISNLVSAEDAFPEEVILESKESAGTFAQNFDKGILKNVTDPNIKHYGSKFSYLAFSPGIDYSEDKLKLVDLGFDNLEVSIATAGDPRSDTDPTLPWNQNKKEEVLERFPDKDDQLEFEMTYWNELLSSELYHKELRAVNHILRRYDRELEANIGGDYVRDDILSEEATDMVILNFDASITDLSEEFDIRPFCYLDNSEVVISTPEFEKLDFMATDYDKGYYPEFVDAPDFPDIDVGLSHLTLKYPTVDGFLERV